MAPRPEGRWTLRDEQVSQTHCSSPIRFPQAGQVGRVRQACDYYYFDDKADLYTTMLLYYMAEVFAVR